MKIANRIITLLVFTCVTSSLAQIRPKSSSESKENRELPVFSYFTCKHKLERCRGSSYKDGVSSLEDLSSALIEVTDDVAGIAGALETIVTKAKAINFVEMYQQVVNVSPKEVLEIIVAAPGILRDLQAIIAEVDPPKRALQYLKTIVDHARYLLRAVVGTVFDSVDAVISLTSELVDRVIDSSGLAPVALSGVATTTALFLAGTVGNIVAVVGSDYYLRKSYACEAELEQCQFQSFISDAVSGLVQVVGVLP